MYVCKKDGIQVFVEQPLLYCAGWHFSTAELIATIPSRFRYMAIFRFSILYDFANPARSVW
jgi:hypothetical protein